MHEAHRAGTLGLVCAESFDAWRELLQERMPEIRNAWDGKPPPSQSDEESDTTVPPQHKKRLGSLKLQSATTTQHHRGGSSLSGAAAPVHEGLTIDLGINLPTRDAEPHVSTADNGQSGKWNLDPFPVHPVSTFIANL